MNKHIIIIGAGFAGLKLARTLNNHPDYCVTLLDKKKQHPPISTIVLPSCDGEFRCQ